MQDPMMRASESELGQDLIGIANEVPVGEKQQLDQVERCGVPLPGFGGDQMTHRFESYVSHVDIFLVFCYWSEVLCETIVRAPPCSPACGGGREGVSWVDTALIEPSPYRDMSLEAKAAATIKRGSCL